MILYKQTEESLGCSFDKIKKRDKIICKCDYCEETFSRTKSNLERSHKYLETDCCSKIDCIKLKRLAVFNKQYGVNNPFQSSAIKEKIKQTNIEKYGVENPLQSEEIKLKHQQSIKELYGVNNVFANKEIQQKIKINNIKKYGVENAMQREDIKLKHKQKVEQLYGVSHYSKTKEYKEKIKKINIEKYGVEHNFQFKGCKEKIKKINIEKYGVENVFQNKQIKENIKQTNIEKYGVENVMQNKDILQKAINTCIERYGKYPVGNYGKTQNEIKEWLNSFGYNFTTNYKILNGKEIDLYDSNVNLAIEYCGLYWHNDCSPEPRDQKYHYNKYKTCLEQNIQLLTIFEDEWLLREKQCKGHIKSIISKQNNKIYARKCDIKILDKKEADNFFDNYHIQGKNNLSKIAFGLFYNKELVAAMSLGRHHRQNGIKEDKIMLDRLCFKFDYQITGGASKLFKACCDWAKQNEYKQIVSFSDNRWSLGRIYKVLNFICDKEYLSDYSYVDLSKPTERLSKQSQKKKNTNCPNGLTERVWALERGLARIWDCGKKRWIFNL